VSLWARGPVGLWACGSVGPSVMMATSWTAGSDAVSESEDKGPSGTRRRWRTLVTMRILVVTASKHHATEEIGDAIVAELRAGGHEARRAAPADVRHLDGIDAVVLGSAVYMTQWMESMRDLVARLGGELRKRPVWAFSCGLAGVAATGTVQDPVRASAVVRQVDPIGYRTFPGRLDPTALALRERSVIRLSGAPEGDYRDWDEIRSWARSIARELETHLAQAG
jgi:menaquinone-dependent protoporphyrinogen oxidase